MFDMRLRGADNTSMRQRSLYSVIIVVLAVGIIIFASGSLTAPENKYSTVVFGEGQRITLTGEVVCLPHRDQSGPHTLECAYGFKAEDGTYYQLSDPTSNSSLLASAPMNEKVTIKGHYSTDADSKYLQNGKIELTEINR